MNKPHDRSGAVIERLIDRLENYYAFECEGGPLKNCVEWTALKHLALAAAPVPCAASPADEARLEFIRGVIEDTLADGPRPATKHQLERALRAIRIELTKARATREEPK